MAETLRARLRVARVDDSLLVERPDWKRVYPFGRIGSSVVGAVGTDHAGLSGIEYSFNKRLRGRVRREVRLTAASGRTVSEIQAGDMASKGADIRLSLSMNLQKESEAQLAKLGAQQSILQGAAVTIDASSGRVLAAGAFPTYDFNMLIGMGPTNVAWSPAFRNRVDTPIGSFLPVGAAGVVAGNLSFKQGMGRSLLNSFRGDRLPWNWISETTWRPSSDELADAIDRHRLREPLGFFDSHGIVHLDRRSVVGLVVAMTPLHLARLAAEFANGGVAVQPTILASSPMPNGSVPGTRILPRGVADGFVSMLEERWEKRWADQAEIPGFRIGGIESVAKMREFSDVVFVGFSRNERSGEVLVTCVVLSWVGAAEDGREAAVKVFRRINAIASWEREGWKLETQGGAD